MNKSIALIITLMACLSLFAERIVIVDEDNKPIDKVLVISEGRAFYSNDEGILNVYVSSDSLEFIRPGYERLTLNSKELESKIVLNKSSYKLAGIKVTTERMEPVFKFGDSEKIVIHNDDRVYDNSADLFSSRTDIRIGNAGLKGEENTISLLGHSERHTAIIVDGVVMNPSGQSFDISTIPAESIESVEIVKNNASVSVGSGAMAGAVVITTKKLNKGTFKPFVGLGAGSFGFNKETVGFEGSTARLNWSVIASRLDTDNDYEYETRDYVNQESYTTNRKNNGKEIYDVNLKLEIPFKRALVSYNGMYEDFEKQMPGGYNFEMHYDKAEQTGIITRHNLSLEHDWGVSFKGYYHKSDSDFDNTESSTPSAMLKTHNDNKLSKSGANLSWNKRTELIELNSRLEYAYETYSSKDYVNSINSVPEKENSSYAGSSAISLKPRVGDFSFRSDASLRWDDYKNFGDFLSGRLYSGVTYENLWKVNLGLSYGTGFTVPSLESLYWKGYPSAVGNPDLEAEESEGWQLSTSVAYPEIVKLKYGLNRNEINKMIYWIRSSVFGGVWKPKNVGKSLITNHEVSVELKPIKNLTFNTSCTFTEALDKTKIDGEESVFYDNHIVYIPEYQVVSTLVYKLKNLNLMLEWRHTGKQWTTQDNKIDPLDEYGLLNTEISYKYRTGNFEHLLTGRLDNILDEQYEVVAYIPQPGINYTLSYIIKINI